MIANTKLLNRLKALILILLAIFFFQKFYSGTLFYYIGPRFTWLAVVAAMLLIALAGSFNLVDLQHSEAGVPLHRSEHDPGHEQANAWPLLIVALPLILGWLIPARPLGANAVPNRGISTSVATAADTAASTLTIVPSERNVLDWVRAMSQSPDPAALTGQQADVVGFVYRDVRFADNQFMVGRFTLTCCVADATAIGIVVQSEDSSQFAADSWVRVRGTFAEGVLDGNPLPVLFASEITPVEPPEQPYLFP